MTAYLRDESTCIACGSPFTTTANVVVRFGGSERVAVLTCERGHDIVITTTMVSNGRANRPPAVQSGEEADEVVARHDTNKRAYLDRQKVQA